MRQPFLPAESSIVYHVAFSLKQPVAEHQNAGVFRWIYQPTTSGPAGGTRVKTQRSPAKRRRRLRATADSGVRQTARLAAPACLRRHSSRRRDDLNETYSKSADTLMESAAVSTAAAGMPPKLHERDLVILAIPLSSPSGKGISIRAPADMCKMRPSNVAKSEMLVYTQRLRTHE